MPENGEWTSDTPAFLIDVDSLDENELTGDDVPTFAEERGLVETLDSGTLESIYVSAERLESPPSDETLLEAFQYYFRFDAFLPQIDAPDPPPTDDVIRSVDREYYESLGEERPDTTCGREGCHRGTVPFSVFCRPHHFENVKGKACPFDD